jgi:hypothetical protein
MGVFISLFCPSPVVSAGQYIYLGLYICVTGLRLLLERSNTEQPAPKVHKVRKYGRTEKHFVSPLVLND